MSALVHATSHKTHTHAHRHTLYGVTTVPLKWLLCNSDLTPKKTPNTTKQHEHPTPNPTLNLFSHFQSVLCVNQWVKCGKIISTWQKSFSEAFVASLRKWEREVGGVCSSKLFRFMSSYACPFWAVKHFQPESIAECSNPTQSLARSHIHICFHRELPVK